MAIQPEQVIRENGFWTHPGLPLERWGEQLTKEEFRNFETNNQFEVAFVQMVEDADETFIDAWFDDGLSDCSPWTPTPPKDSAFLLSIHDTEDGPVAWFALPNALEGNPS